MSSTNLKKRLREQRKLSIKLDARRTLFALRPTDLDMYGLDRLKGQEKTERLLESVIDWEGFNEDDIVGGGCSDLVPFDADLFREWAADKAVTWGPIADTIYNAYIDHAKKEGEAEKN